MPTEIDIILLEVFGESIGCNIFKTTPSLAASKLLISHAIVMCRRGCAAAQMSPSHFLFSHYRLPFLLSTPNQLASNSC
jgi:hypothetical protein